MDPLDMEDVGAAAAAAMMLDGVEPRTRGGGDLGAGAGGLDAILSIPVTVQVVLGTTTMSVAKLMKLGRGAVITLDQKVGSSVSVLVNGRVVARGEVVVVDEDNSRFGVSLTEIVGKN